MKTNILIGSLFTLAIASITYVIWEPSSKPRLEQVTDAGSQMIFKYSQYGATWSAYTDCKSYGWTTRTGENDYHYHEVSSLEDQEIFSQVCFDNP